MQDPSEKDAVEQQELQKELINRIADYAAIKRGRQRSPVTLGEEGWRPVTLDRSQPFHWFFRKERKVEPRVYAACARHREFLVSHHFQPGRATKGERLTPPTSCVLCEGGIYEREVVECRCRTAPKQCPIIHHRWRH